MNKVAVIGVKHHVCIAHFLRKNGHHVTLYDQNATWNPNIFRIMQVLFANHECVTVNITSFVEKSCGPSMLLTRMNSLS